MTRTLIANMVKGVSEGYQRTLIVEGVGYAGEVRGGKDLALRLGFSHEVVINPPPNISFEVEGRNPTTIHINGIDKQVVGQVAANIRELRPPEPYLGKGIRYSDEIIRRKEGKAGKEVRVPLRSVLEGSDPKANLLLRGGEEVRVPTTGRVFIIGSVNKPGPVSLGEARPMNLLQVVAMAGGPIATAGKRAYLLRPSEGGATHREIPFDLKKLMKGQEENLALQANDVIFVPDSRIRRFAAGVGPAAANSVLYMVAGVLLWR